MSLLAITAITATIAGCQTTGTSEPGETRTWELANAQPIKPLLLGRTRLSPDRPLPDHMTNSFAPQFTLITISSYRDWESLRSRTQLPEAPAEVDLSRGMIVGILADVGESVHDRWPIRLLGVRTQSGNGWIDASFTPGLYHPIKTAGYLELAYVPGLREVQMVRINRRHYPIRQSTSLH